MYKKTAKRQKIMAIKSSKHEKDQFCEPDAKEPLVPGVPDALHSKKLGKKNADKPYRCPNCSESFSMNKFYQRHLRSHLQYHAYECNVCLESFDKKEFLLAHKETHTSSKTYPCSKCSKTFSHVCALNRHLLTHLCKPPYPCPICGSKFSTISSRSRHVKNHVVSCGLCRIDFQDLSQLIGHIEEMHRPKLDKDSKEDYIVPVEVNKTNNDEMVDARPEEQLPKKSSGTKKDDSEKFVCFVCEQCFSSEDSLNSHLKAHRLFLCTHCPQFFAHLSALLDHEFIHTGIHPFKCDTCGSIFHSAKRLGRHQKDCKTSCLVKHESNVDGTLQTAFRGNMDYEVSRSVDNTVGDQELCSKALERLQMEMDSIVLAQQSSENLCVAQNVCSDLVFPPQELNECVTPSLDFNNVWHFAWLNDFVKETKSMNYPLEKDLLKKVAHLHSILCEELLNPTGVLSMKKNFLFLLFCQKNLSFILSDHFQRHCAELS